MGSLKRVLGIVGGLLFAFMAIGYGWILSSVPNLDQDVSVEGIDAPVAIARDKHGIPHITGQSDADVFFGLGFAHAQDRLWQMEMNRRIGNGRVAEVLGEQGLGFDKYFRTLGFADRAASAWENLDEETRSLLQAYADGVNAFLDSHKGAWPPEFILTGTTPEPWSPLDTLVWQKMMWLSLSGNMRHELARARLLTKLSPAQVQAMYPTYPGDEELPFQTLDSVYDDALKALMDITGGEPEAVIGSNNWVISGERTVSGKPLLANDPHLGLTTPSIWYLTRLHNTTTGENLAGVGFPGSPSIILGRNDTIAWGFTNTASDVQDLFLEKLVDGGSKYLTPDGPADFKLRNELIKVSGGDDVLLTVRETRHGPVISDVSDDNSEFMRDGYVLALQWTALLKEDQAVRGILDLTRSKHFEAFKAAGTHYFGPEQNMVYADTAGNIGYYAPALVPIRHPDNNINGRLPSPGWDAKYDWQGYIPYEDLPTRYNSESGIIATANEKIVGNDYPYYLTRDWALPYRGNRIRAGLQSREKHDLESFAALHFDTTSDMARDLMRYLLAALRSEGKADDDIVSALSAWQGEMMVDRPEPLVFHTWLRYYQASLMSDELGDLYTDFKSLRTRLIKSSLFWSDIATTKIAPPPYELPALPRELALPWCDNIATTDVQERCTALAAEAFKAAIDDLTTNHGANWQAWRWGDEHILTQSHRPFSQVPVLKDFFEISAPVGGSVHTINVAGVSQSDDQRHRSGFGASYRGIFDFSNLDQSLFIQPTGQSGNPLSPHFDDLFPLWLRGDYITIPTSQTGPVSAVHNMVLKPKE